MSLFDKISVMPSPRTAFYCMKCNRAVEGAACHNDISTGQMNVTAYCHGEQEEMQFGQADVSVPVRCFKEFIPNNVD